METQTKNSYFSGLNRRILRYIWLLLFLIFVQVHNLHLITSLNLKGAFDSSMLSALLAWSLLGYLIPVLIPHRLTRRIVVALLLLLISTFYLTDIYLLFTYRLPYSYSLALPIIATTPSEAMGFLQFSGGDSRPVLLGVLYLFSMLAVAFLLPWLVRWLLKLISKPSLHQFSPFKVQFRWKPWLAAIGLLLIVSVGIFHARGLYKLYRSDWVRYNGMVLPERLFIAERMAHKELQRFQLGDRPQIPDSARLERMFSLDFPHNVVVVYDRLIYPKLMHCYGHDMLNTPQIDSLVKSKDLHLFTKAYASDNNEQNAVSRTLTFYHHESTQPWHHYPSLSGVMRLAGYKTYWLDNNPRSEPWLEVVPQLSSDCDSAFYTHLRGSEEYWNHNAPLDEAVLEHLDWATPHNRPLFSVVHLLGASGNIWSRTRKPYNPFDRRTLGERDRLSEAEYVDLAQYHNVILYHDALLGRVLQAYSTTPSIVLYVGNVGADGENHPYEHLQITSLDRNRVPMMVYLSPSMKRQCPEMEQRIRTLCNELFSVERLPELITELLGFRYHL